jgi:membrane-associated phospholipid phosphatase
MRHAAVTRWRVLCLGSALALTLLGTAATGGVLPGDVELRHELVEEASASLYAVALWANFAGHWHGLLPGFVLLMLVSRVARRHWWLWSAVLLAAPVMEFVVKRLVDRPRPNSDFPGFPSGHVTALTAFAVVAMHLAEREGLGRAWRVALAGVLAVLIALVALARLSLHAHWPSDVLGGMLLGTACAAAGAWWHSARAGVQRPAAGAPPAATAGGA